MEIWDVLDKNGRPTGKTVVRGKRGLAKGEYHLVVHIWIIDDDGNFLIQRRSENKLLMPGEWAATGGSAFSKETSRHAAARELSEEIGILLPRQDLKLVKRLLRRFSITDVWAARCNISAENLILQAEEVAEVKWVSPNELRNMIRGGQFHNYGKDYFDLIFSINDLI